MIHINKGTEPEDGKENRSDQTRILKKVYKDLLDMYGRAQKENITNWVKFTKDFAKYLKEEKGISSRIADNTFVGDGLVSDVDEDRYVVGKVVGFQSDAFDSSLYASQAIKQQLLEEQRGCCAYCEAYIVATQYGDVEHFRPKAGFNQIHNSAPPSHREGYFWLAYTWENLYYACVICNEHHKKNRFPTVGGIHLTFDDSVTEETTALIDPGVEEPRNFIRFNPMTGEAYAFDSFHAHFGGDAEEMAWNTPVDLESLSRDASQKIPNSRGNATIAILGLNRQTLVRQRLEHLRLLRALFDAGNFSEIDDDSAQAATNPENSEFVTEFRSVSLDALQTWHAEKSNVDPDQAIKWIEGYNKLLAKTPNYVPLLPLKLQDSPLIYLYNPNDENRATLIRLMYFKANDELELPDQHSFFASIEEEDLENEVFVIKGGEQEETLTLQGLINLPQPWRKFVNRDVIVKGNYSRFENAFGQG